MWGYVFVFALILITPFLNLSSLKVLNTLPVKVLILLSIISVSFIDMHLSILLAILYFIILINIQKTKETYNDKVFQYMISTPSYTNVQSESSNSCVPNTEQLSTDMSSFFLDEKTKPYVTYIEKLSPLDSFNKIQCNQLE